MDCDVHGTKAGAMCQAGNAASRVRAIERGKHVGGISSLHANGGRRATPLRQEKPRRSYERVIEVRGDENEGPSRAQHTGNFAKDEVRLGEVLHHHVCGNDVEAARRERECVAERPDGTGQAPVAFEVCRDGIGPDEAPRAAGERVRRDHAEPVV